MSWSDCAVVADFLRRPQAAGLVVHVVDGEQFLAVVARGARITLRLTALSLLLLQATPGAAVAVTVAGATVSATTTAGNLDRLMTVVDILRKLGKYIAIGSLMFSGIMWMGGHRTEATERAVGTAIGYLLVNHAADIIGFLDGI